METRTFCYSHAFSFIMKNSSTFMKKKNEKPSRRRASTSSTLTRIQCICREFSDCGR